MGWGSGPSGDLQTLSATSAGTLVKYGKDDAFVVTLAKYGKDDVFINELQQKWENSIIL